VVAVVVAAAQHGRPRCRRRHRRQANPSCPSSLPRPVCTGYGDGKETEGRGGRLVRTAWRTTLHGLSGGPLILLIKRVCGVDRRITAPVNMQIMFPGLVLEFASCCAACATPLAVSACGVKAWYTLALYGFDPG
jgi:hypothetical protein